MKKLKLIILILLIFTYCVIAYAWTFPGAWGNIINFLKACSTSIIPSADDTYSLGSSTKEWKDLYVDGTANIDTLAGDTATFTGLGTFDKLSLTNTASSYDDIISANDEFTIQMTEPDDGFSSLFVNAPLGGNIALTLWADGEAGSWAPWFGIAVNKTTSDIVLSSDLPLDWLIHNDINDYMRFQTVSNVPEITTVGACDLKLTASSGTIDMDDDNLTTTGSGTFASLDVSDGNITNVGEIDLDLIRADAANGTVTIELDDAAGADLLVGNNSALVVEGDTDWVGIGTVDPDGNLQVSNDAVGSGTPIVYITNETANQNYDPQLRFSTGSTPVTHWSLGIDDGATNDPFLFATGALSEANAKLVLEKGGQIGIGVFDPDTKLEIFNAGNQLKLSYDGTDNTIFAVDTAGKLTVTPSGGDITFSSDLDIEDDTPHVRLTDTDTNQDDYEMYADYNQAYFTNVTDEVIIWKVKENNDFIIPAVNVGIGTASPDYKLSIGSTDGSDQIGIYHDNTDAFITSLDDGDIKFESESGYYKFNHTAGKTVGFAQFYNSDQSQSLQFGFSGSPQIYSVNAPLSLNYDASQSIRMFAGCTEGTTQELWIGGFRTGDGVARKYLFIGVGVDAADTASFDGVSNYYFDGNVGIGAATPTSALQMGDDKLIAVDVNSGLTASTTQSQGQGALTAQVNEIATVANDDDTVTLPSAIAGVEIEIINNGAKTLQIFPASGDALGLGVNTAEELEANERVKYVAYDTTNWAKESSTEIIHAEIHDEDNTDAFVVNDAGGDFHSYHTNGLAAGDLADWTFDAGGAGTSHAITGIANAGGGDITVTTADNHLLAVGDIISQTNLADAAYVGIFDVLTVPTATTYTVTATYTATGTGTMDQAATLEANAVAAGVYSFAYCISGTPVGNNETFDFQLYKEATVITGSKIRRKFGAGGDFGSMSGCGVVAVANGDKISLAISNEDSAANLTIRNLTIVLIRL